MLSGPLLVLAAWTNLYTLTGQGCAAFSGNCGRLVDCCITGYHLRLSAAVFFSLQGVTISNDGATIMKLLEIIHPAAKTLVDISLSQDAEVLPSPPQI